GVTLSELVQSLTFFGGMMSQDDHSRQSVTREKNRDAVLNAGRDLFYLNGYGGTSLALIAQRADVSTATLFKHFSTKSALLRAVIEREWVAADVELKHLPDTDIRARL